MFGGLLCLLDPVAYADAGSMHQVNTPPVAHLVTDRGATGRQALPEKAALSTHTRQRPASKAVDDKPDDSQDSLFLTTGIIVFTGLLTLLGLISEDA